MTLNDGILTIYETVNAASAGSKPDIRLTEKGKHYFGFETVGFNRYYTAMQANNQIEAVVQIWEDRTITSLDICVLEDQVQYRIVQAQHFIDAEGLRKTKLSLERLKDEYQYQD